MVRQRIIWTRGKYRVDAEYTALARHLMKPAIYEANFAFDEAAICAASGAFDEAAAPHRSPHSGLTLALPALPSTRLPPVSVRL